jgi:hypothetical protein
MDMTFTLKLDYSLKGKLKLTILSVLPNISYRRELKHEINGEN